MDHLRKQSSSQMQSMIKTPKAVSSNTGGLKNSVLNFFKFDSLFGKSQERVQSKLPDKNDLANQQITSTKQILQKQNYQSNLMEELSIENDRLNESVPFTEPVSSIANTGKISRAASNNLQKQQPQGVSFLQQYRKGS